MSLVPALRIAKDPPHAQMVTSGDPCPRCSARSEVWSVGLLEVPRRILVLDHDRRVACTVCHQCGVWIPFRTAPFAEVVEQVKQTTRWSRVRTLFPVAISWAPSGEMLLIRGSSSATTSTAVGDVGTLAEPSGGEFHFSNETAAAEERAAWVVTAGTLLICALLFTFSPRGIVAELRYLAAIAAGAIGGDILIRLAALRPLSLGSRVAIPAILFGAVALLPLEYLIAPALSRIGVAVLTGLLVGIINSTLPWHRGSSPDPDPLPRVSDLAVRTAMVAIDRNGIRLRYRRFSGPRALDGSAALREAAALLGWAARKEPPEILEQGRELAFALGGWRGVAHLFGRDGRFIALAGLDQLSLAALLAIVTHELLQQRSAELLVGRDDGARWGAAWDEIEQDPA